MAIIDRDEALQQFTSATGVLIASLIEQISAANAELGAKMAEAINLAAVGIRVDIHPSPFSAEIHLISDEGERLVSLVGAQTQWDVADGFRVTLSGEDSDISAPGMSAPLKSAYTSTENTFVVP